MEDNYYEEEMDDVNLDDYKEYHWMMVPEENYGGVGDKKALIYAKRWYV